MSVFHYGMTHGAEVCAPACEQSAAKVPELCVVSDIREPLLKRTMAARIAVEYGQFTCYDFSVLDSDRHVAT
jgi:hypothetical protein